MIGTGLFLIVLNLLVGLNGNNYPRAASELENALYYGLSRPSFVTGTMLILLSIFFGRFTLAQSLLSTSVMRIVAKSLPIACATVILAVQILYCSEAMPEGFFVDLPIAIGVGFGLVMATLIISIILMVFVEFPIHRTL